mgnify:FL=1|jgi:uncharacterized protein YqeY
MLNFDVLIKASMITKDAAGLRVYRNLKTDIMNFKTQKNAPKYDDAEEIKIIKKYYTKMEDAEKQYLEAGRQDLATECREELDILKTLLPEPVSPEKIYEELWKFGIANDCIYESKLIIPKNKMGIAIKFMKAIFPTADGKMISDVVKEYVG